ncbi:hypothetical protein [Microbulbifer sp. TYP-18]|uniref:hypothetical protein n=1 Tax=Microbulbifer sp. TYP-18 TaxID=3230024 RepID=UPI0034C6087A
MNKSFITGFFIFGLMATSAVAQGTEPDVGVEVECTTVTIKSPDGCLAASEFLKINDRAEVSVDHIRVGNDNQPSNRALDIGSNAVVEALMIDVIGTVFDRNTDITVSQLRFKRYIEGFSLVTQNNNLTPDYLRSKIETVPNLPSVEITTREITTGTTNYTLEANTTRTLVPGRYGEVIVRGQAELRLSGGGEYTFKRLIIEDAATFMLEDNSVKHTLLVDKEFRWGDRISTRHFPNSLTVYTNHGNPSDSTTQMGDLSINGNFTGKLYAPYAKVVLGNGKIYKGCLFAKNIELHQDSEITGTNVETKRVCECKIIEPVNNGI